MIQSPKIRKILAIAFVLALPALFLVPAAYQAYPCPFETNLMGNSIQFPIYMGAFENAHPTLVARQGLFYRTTYVDSRHPDYRLEWLFRPTLAQRGANTPLYGVNFYLNGRPERLDSVKTALEKQFSIKLMPYVAHRDGIAVPSGYSASLTDCTTLFVRELNQHENGSASGIRIAISNHLSNKEEGYFISTDGDIEPNVD